MKGRSTMLAIVIGLFVGLVTDAGAAVRLESDSEIATAGYFRLQWEVSDTPTRLVESLNPSFEKRNLIYEGPDTARLISGKSNGQYFYRLERAGTDDMAGIPAVVVSNTLQVTVKHHSLVRAFTFFAIGAAVFAATLVLVLLGGRREYRQ